MSDLRGPSIGERAGAAARTLRGQLIILGSFVVIIWLVEFVDWLFLDGALDAYGVKPRTVSGLRGILFMPFLHRGFNHLLANTFPILILGWMVMVRRTADLFIVAAISVFVGGLGIWLFGASGSVHVGASVLVFGFFGFLMARAFFERSLTSITLAIVVFIFYGGIIWGVLPGQDGISWLGHLFGFIGGILAAYFITRRRVAL
ncbi:MAG: rhomboid family intramembrane serine protease [Chloroflexota bacterium]|jgi:membrane associated rhomboid family serine protease